MGWTCMWIVGMVAVLWVQPGSSKRTIDNTGVCKLVLQKLVKSRVVVDDDMLKAVGGSLQTVLDCLPDYADVRLSVEEIAPPITIERPVSITSLLDFTRLKCQDEANQDILFKIRSHNVTVSKLRIEGCKRDSNRGVIDMQSSNYQVLDSVQCVRNENAAGPSCISAWNTTSTIKGMHALDNIGGVGGVLHMGYSTVIIHHGKFTGNKANYSGGAAYFRSCKLKVHDTLFNGNEASEGGGALAIQDGGSANIAQSKFTENLAKGSGGAIAFLTVANYGTSIVKVQIQNTDFDQNDGYTGGAVSVEMSVNMTVSETSFYNNTGHQIGGALSIRTPEFERKATAVVQVVNSQFQHNRAGLPRTFALHKDSPLTSNRIGGGAVGLEGQFSQFICEDTYFYNNFAMAGGAILLENAVLLRLTRSKFVDHRAVLGGAIAALNAEIKMHVDSTEFENNIARKGGAVLLEWFSTVGTDDTLQRKDLLGSTLFPDSVIRFEEVRFIENHAYEAGGAIDISGLVLRCYKCSFPRNTIKAKTGSSTGEGGAMRIRDAAAVVLEHTKIESCRGEVGGGVYLKDSFLVAKNSSWIGNHADNAGGAIAGDYMDSSPLGKSATVDLLDCNFTNNTVGRAGIVHIAAYRAQDRTSSLISSIVGEAVLPGPMSDDSEEGHNEFHPFLLLNNTNLEGNVVKTNTPVVFVKDRYDVQVCCQSKKCITGKDLTMAPCIGQAHNYALPRLLGTSAMEIKVEYQTGTSGKVRSGVPMKPIIVTMIDVFGQEAPQQGTLIVKTEKNEVQLAGAPATGMLINGRSHIQGLIMTAKPGKYNLTIIIQSLESSSVILKKNVDVEVQHCTVGEASKVNGTFCEECRPNFYNFNLTGLDCIKCPNEGIFCPGPTVTPKDGWWHSSSHSPIVRSCFVERACQYDNRTEILGNASLAYGEKELKWDDSNYDLCAPAYEGILCGSCKEGYGKGPSMTCEKCPDWFALLPRLAAAAIQLIVTALLFMKGANDYAKEILTSGKLQKSQTLDLDSLKDYFRGESFDTIAEVQHRRMRCKREIMLDPTDILKILVTYLQVTTTAVSINLQWNDFMLNVMDGFDWLSGITTSSGYFATSCLFKGSERSIYANAAAVSMPFILWVCVALYGLLRYYQGKKTRAQIATHCFVAGMSVLDLAYIGLTDKAAQIFTYATVNLGGSSPSIVWMEDTRIGYFSLPHWLLMGIVGLPLILFNTLGFPIFVYFMLGHRKTSLHAENVVSRFGFFYQSYRSRCAYWEVVIYLRKAGIAILTISAYALQPVLQAFLYLGTLVICLAAQVHYQPYKESKLNKMEEASIFVSISVYILGGVVQCFAGNKPAQLALSISMILVLSSFVVYMLCEWVYAYWQILRDWVRKQEEYDNHTGGWFSICSVVVNIFSTRSKNALNRAQTRFSTLVKLNLSRYRPETVCNAAMDDTPEGWKEDSLSSNEGVSEDKCTV